LEVSVSLFNQSRPTHGEDLRRTFLHWSLFYSCWNSSPYTKVRWCPIKLWLFAVVREVAYEIRTNSFAQRCNKKVRNRMKCYKCRKLQSSQPEDAIRIAMVLW